MRTGTQWQNIVSTISHMCDIVDTMFCHCGSVTLCHTAYISGGIHRIEHQVCNKYAYRAYILINVSSYKLENTLVFNYPSSPANILVNRAYNKIYIIIAGLDVGLHSPW